MGNMSNVGCALILQQDQPLGYLGDIRCIVRCVQIEQDRYVPIILLQVREAGSKDSGKFQVCMSRGQAPAQRTC